MTRRSGHLYVIAILFFLMLGCSTNDRSSQSDPRVIAPDSYTEIKEVFDSLGYAWDTLGEGVPPLLLERLPQDFDRIAQLTEKKRTFFLSLLPMVLMANDELRRARAELERLFRLQDGGIRLDGVQRKVVASLAREYGVDDDPLTDPSARRELLRRIDIIPPSMALAQAATESAYGTSRFAREGNNLFGEWTFVPGAGIVPRQRPEGHTYEVRRFATLYDSVQSYMKNLNTHEAYRSFREQRAHLRAAGMPLQGVTLARNLENYSSRGEAYIADVRSIIRRNRLVVTGAATLRSLPAVSTASTVQRAAGLLACRECSSRTRAFGENP